MAIPLQKRSYYEFGPFRIDPLGRLLLRDGAVVPTTPKQFDILLLLVESRGQVVGKERLLEEVWPDTSVEEGNLTTNIYSLRKALGEAGNGQPYIQTAPRRGYRFVAEVREVLAEEGWSIGKEPIPLHLVMRQADERQLPEKALTPSVWERLRARRRVALPALAVLAVAIAVITIWVVKRPKAVGSGGGVKTLAVLPFKPLIEGSRNESLEIGMAETLINKLSSIRQLIVRPLSSVIEYTASSQDAVAIGQELKVDYVLEGRLQMEGKKTRATVRLMSVKDGTAVWTDTCDEQCSTLFALQDAIATRIAAALATKLSGDERNRLAKHDTESTDAYQAYMWGRFLLNKQDPRTIEKAVAYLEQAIQLDPNYALAYVALADSYPSFSKRGLSPAEVRAKKKELVARALAIDDTLAEAHAAWGNSKADDRDWPEAEQSFKRALELNPNSAEVHGEYAGYLWNRKRFEEALAEKRRAVELEPTSALHNRNVAIYLYYLRRYDEAIEQCRKALELDDEMPTVYRWLAQSYELKGLYDQAIEAYLKTAEFNDYGPEVEAALRAAYATSGWQGFWRKSVELKLERAKHRKVSSWAFAQTYMRIGETDQAFAWLEKMVEEGGAMRLVVEDPMFDDLRSDPRYADLTQRTNSKP